MKSVTRDGGLLYICMDWRGLSALDQVASELNLIQINLIVWSKTNAGMGSLYRSQHELIAIYKVGNASHTNHVQLGKYGRNRTNVWTFPGANSFGKSRDQDLADHPTVKPVAMVAEAIKDVTKSGDLVLDTFCVSGTILLACERTGRKARAIELDPVYVDTAIKRFARRVGIEAVLAETGETFSQIKTHRASEPSALSPSQPSPESQGDDANGSCEPRFTMINGKRIGRRTRSTRSVPAPSPAPTERGACKRAGT